MSARRSPKPVANSNKAGSGPASGRPDPSVAFRMHLTRHPDLERHSQLRSISWAVSMKRRTSSTVAATSCLFTISLTVWT